MLYETIIQNIRSLTIEERKQLINEIIDSLLEEQETRTRDILEFEGIGAHLRDDSIDAQEYVNRLRSEWDHRP